ncbi:hypothetical protein ACOMHN_059909 [Nucella lapillus]
MVAILGSIPLCLEWRKISYDPSVYTCRWSHTVKAVQLSIIGVFLVIVTCLIVYCNVAIYCKCMERFSSTEEVLGYIRSVRSTPSDSSVDLAQGVDDHQHVRSAEHTPMNVDGVGQRIETGRGNQRTPTFVSIDSILQNLDLDQYMPLENSHLLNSTEGVAHDMQLSYELPANRSSSVDDLCLVETETCDSGTVTSTSADTVHTSADTRKPDDLLSHVSELKTKEAQSSSGTSKEQQKSTGKVDNTQVKYPDEARSGEIPTPSVISSETHEKDSKSHDTDNNDTFKEALKLIVMLLICINSMCNPIIYGWGNLNIRNGYKRQFPWLFEPRKHKKSDERRHAEMGK